jgi:hypothetical protein
MAIFEGQDSMAADICDLESMYCVRVEGCVSFSCRPQSFYLALALRKTHVFDHHLLLLFGGIDACGGGAAAGQLEAWEGHFATDRR